MAGYGTGYVNLPGEGSWRPPVATATALPPSGNTVGDAIITQDTDTIYVWNGTAWVAVATPGAAIALDGLIGDVSATGPGVAIATVNSVGGQTAANIATATALVNSSEAASKFFASPATTAGVPTFRSIVATDIPTLNQNTTGTASNITATSNSTLTTLSALSLPASQVTGITATTLTGYAVGANTPILATDTILTAFEKIQGQLNAESSAAITALTGDGTATGPGSATLTLATVNPNVGTFGSGSQVPVITVNAKGLITGVTTAATPQGTVTSVGLTTPNVLYSVSNSPITSSGNIALTLLTQPANQVFAGPTSGSSATPGFRSLVAADIPSISLTSGVTGVLPVSNGGTSQTTAQAARGPSGLNIDERTTVNAVNYTGVSTDRYIANIGTLTSAGITITLPAASSVNAGQVLYVSDESGTCSTSNVITIAAAGSDTIDGAASKVLRTAYGYSILIANGSNGWFVGTIGIGRGGTGLMTLPTSGQLLIGNSTTSSYNLNTITAGSNIAVTNGPGTISVGLTGTVPVANGGTNNSSAYTAGSVIFSNGTSLTQDNSQLFWNDTNHYLGIGTTAPDSPITVNAGTTVLPAPPSGTFPAIHLGGATGVGAYALVDSFGNTSQMLFRRADTSAAAPSAVQSGDQIANIVFSGYGATSYQANGAAKIVAAASENFTDATGAGNLEFYTRPTGTVAMATERMRIAETGNVGINTTTPVNKLDVSGGVAIGAYAGTNAATTNGLIVSGRIGAGITNPIQAVDTGSTGQVRTGGLVGASATPTVTYGAGAGTGPTTVALVGSALAGYIQFTTGTGTTANSNVITFTLPITYPNYAFGNFQPANNNAAAAYINITSSSTPNTVTLNTAGSALAASTTYAFNYLITGY